MREVHIELHRMKNSQKKLGICGQILERKNGLDSYDAQFKCVH